MRNFILILIVIICFQSCKRNQNQALLKKLNLEFATIPKGEFLMGSNYYKGLAPEEHPEWYKDESPVRSVTLTSDFELGKYEITNRQFEIFIKNTGYITEAENINKGSYGLYNDSKNVWEYSDKLNWKDTGFSIEKEYPVIHVTWNDAIKFCEWLNGIDSNYSYSLPTEAQWEYAASYAGKHIYSWGNENPNSNKGGNIADFSFMQRFPNWKYPIYSEYNDNHPLLSKVGSYEPNPYGLYDMTGNVWEWVMDTYKEYDENNIVNPKYELSSNAIQEKVIRGGGFDWELPFLRVRKRRKLPLDKKSISISQLKYNSAINVGFRIKRIKK